MEISVGEACIDLFFLFLCLRSVYIAISRGTASEIFRLVGLLTGAILAFQFYPALSKNFRDALPFINKQYFYFFSFLSIFVSTLVLFGLLRAIVGFLTKKEEASIAQRWLLFLTGLFRALFLVSTIIFLLFISPLKTDIFNGTFSYKILKNIAPGVYLTLFNAYTHLKPQTGLELNKDVRDYFEDRPEHEHAGRMTREKGET